MTRFCWNEEPVVNNTSVAPLVPSVYLRQDVTHRRFSVPSGSPLVLSVANKECPRFSFVGCGSAASRLIRPDQTGIAVARQRCTAASNAARVKGLATNDAPRLSICAWGISG